MVDNKEKWKAPEKHSYRNPHVGIYPDLEGYSGELKNVNGAIQTPIQGDSGAIQGNSGVIRSNSRPIHVDSNADYGDYYSDTSDLVNRKNTIKKIFTYKRSNHSARNSDKIYPYRYAIRRIGEVVAVVQLILATLTVMLGAPWRVWVLLYMLMVVTVFLTDALKFTGRMYALQTRVLISLGILAWMLSLVILNKRYHLACIFLSLIFFFIARKNNVFWRDDENFWMSAAVQQVLVNNPKSEVTKVWDTEAKTQARTLCYELGLEIDETVLDGFCRPLVCLGISMMVNKVGIEKSRATKQEKRAEEFKKQFENTLDELYALQSDESDRDAIINLVRERNTAWRDLQEKQKEVEDLKSQIEELKSQIEEPEPDQEVELKNYNNFKNLSKEEQQERVNEVIKLMQEGTPANQAYKIAGVPYKRTLALRKLIMGETA